MSDYSISLFFHIVGAIGMFVALGLEWTGLWQIRSATTSEQVRVWMRISRTTRRLGIASMLTVLISGLYMMATVWGGVPWIYVSLGALVLAVVLMLTLTGPRMAAIGRTIMAEHRPGSPIVHDVANHPLLWVSIQTRVAIALGIVFLKTTKPDLGGSLLVIALAIVIGLASALPVPRRERAQEGSAN